MQNQSIQVKGLQKSYKEIHVLKGVDFEVEKGSIFALLGSNGAGKTTIVKILTTLLKPDGGSAFVNGFDVVSQDDGVRQSLSLTGQFAAVDEILTGRENLIMIARLRHLPDPRQLADDLLKRFALTEAADRRVSTYSGGMRRRLDIAMSLIGKPPVIFLDEPTNGLDPEARREVWRIIKELADGGTTVFLTTQYLEEAEHLADRIAILHAGRIIANGTLEELKKLFPPATVAYVEKQPSFSAGPGIHRRVQLLLHAQVVAVVPHLHHPAVFQPEDVDAGEAQRPAGGRHPAPRAGVGAGHGPARHDQIVLGDEQFDRVGQVGESGAEVGGDLTLAGRARLGGAGAQVVAHVVVGEHFQRYVDVAFVPNLVIEAADDGFVVGRG